MTITKNMIYIRNKSENVGEKLSKYNKNLNDDPENCYFMKMLLVNRKNSSDLGWPGVEILG